MNGRRHVSDFVEKERTAVRKFELSWFAAYSSGEGAFFVAEEFAFEQIFRDGGAVDFDEGAGGAVRVLMDGVGDEILADAAFAAEENGGIRGSDALDERENGLHFFAAGDDIVVVIALAEGFAESAVLFTEAVGVEFLANDEDEFGKGERLQDVVARADFHGFDGGFDRAVSGHDDDGRGGIRALYGLQEFEAGHAGKLEIGDDEIEVVFGEKLKAGFGVGGGLGDEAFVGELELEQAAKLGFVFDDEDGWFLRVHSHRN